MFEKVAYEPRKKSVINNEEVKNKSKNVSKNVTRMVIVSSLMNAILQIPYSAYYLRMYFYYNGSFRKLDAFGYFVNILAHFLPCLDIFYYYFFNRVFKKVLNSYFKKILKLMC